MEEHDFRPGAHLPIHRRQELLCAKAASAHSQALHFWSAQEILKTLGLKALQHLGKKRTSTKCAGESSLLTFELLKKILRFPHGAVTIRSVKLTFK